MMLIKQTDIRRVFAVLATLCAIFFIYFLWQQSPYKTDEEHTHMHGHVRNHRLKLSHESDHRWQQPHQQQGQRENQQSQWTWKCINKRCKRFFDTNDTTLSNGGNSFETCSMLCSSSQLWPQPTGPTILSTVPLTFRPAVLRFGLPQKTLPNFKLLQEAYRIFNASVYRILYMASSPSNTNADTISYQNSKQIVGRFQVDVAVQDPTVVRLQMHTNESYELHMTFNKQNGLLQANIAAHNFFGARHALQTLEQLIWFDPKDQRLKVLSSAKIRDEPRFPYRGVMVDTARNFVPISGLERVLIGMAASKLNVLHWHITDSQSFPMVSKEVPHLSKFGAYDPSKTYTLDEIKYLSEFALVRGVRIVVEVDTPAHSGNGWTFGPALGLGELAVCVNKGPWKSYCGEPPCGQLNPTNPHVYDILEKVYREILNATGEREIFHMGGDEVDLECWAQHLPLNRSDNSSNSLHWSNNDLMQLWGQFTVLSMARLRRANNGRTVPIVMMWSSDLSKGPYHERYLDKQLVVVQSWGASSWSDTIDLLSNGYRVIISHVDAWYLDCGFGRWNEKGDGACGPYRTWQEVYLHRPWQHTLQQFVGKTGILGGEVCLWTELVDNGDVDSRLWPRAAAFAERMWSDPFVDANMLTIDEDVYTRLSTHRERLVNSYGLRAAAMWPYWCTQNPGEC